MPDPRPARIARVTYALTILAFVALLAWGGLHSSLEQFDGKAMGARLLLFPLAGALVPAIWLLGLRAARGAGRGLPTFPWAAATLATLPFVIDLVGNTFSMYIEIEHFDDLVHTINPILGVAAVALLLDRTSAPRWSVWTMAFGLGCAAHIGFELFEYALLVGFGAKELGLTLLDTLSDLGYGMIGAAIGACASLVTRVDRRPVG
ncbi:MAG: hypothetical protein JWM86_1640 [Thermoleophilia bacterium]|nr:hypothetical protein [Thermoleophilia bacterium]